MPTVFVSSGWLADKRERVKLIDVRDPWEYDDGHLPGAVNVPFQDFRDPTDEAPGKLPTVEAFGRTLSNAGIERADRIVVYDGEFGVYAARYLVTAEVLGHDPDRLSVLDGGYRAWAREYETTTVSPHVAPSEYTARWGEDSPIIPAESLEAALDSDAVIVDTRDPLEYETVHVPGAVNFDWQELVDEDRHGLRPRSQCLDILSEYGVTLERPVRLYCNTARRLSFVYAVLRELGHDDVAFYEGGIDAWADYGGPVETTV